MIEAIVIPKNVHSSWYVYEVLDVSDALMYIGFGKAADLLQLPELVANPAFDSSRPYRVKTVHECENRSQALNKASTLLMVKGMPVLNRTARVNRFGMVKCDQTGQIFKNAKIAAERMGISQPNLSQHLSRKPGHKTIKGMTFSYAGFYGSENTIKREEIIE